MRFFIVVVSFLIMPTVWASVETESLEISEIKIHVVRPDIQTYGPWGVKSVKGNADVVVYLRESELITRFLDDLPEEKLEPFENLSMFLPIGYSSKDELRTELKIAGSLKKVIHGRMVVEIFKHQGLSETYWSDGFWLYSEDADKVAAVSDDFFRTWVSWWSKEE